MANKETMEEFPPHYLGWSKKEEYDTQKYM